MIFRFLFLINWNEMITFNLNGYARAFLFTEKNFVGNDFYLCLCYKNKPVPNFYMNYE